jgi:predicted HAD superfamily Cof-like phosphohydrolase
MTKMSIDSIELWHRRARPDPTPENLNVQLGCHVEEFIEMLDAVKLNATWTNLRYELVLLADRLKANMESAEIVDRKEFLDSLADQIVTSVGVGHCAGMKTSDAVDAVSRSNWSKFNDEGFPIFNEHGKIAKGPNYKRPYLEGLY